MENNGRDCASSDWLLGRKCNKSSYWRRNSFCQKSCYEDGNGYEGDVCCTDGPAPPSNCGPRRSRCRADGDCCSGECMGNGRCQ